MAITIAVALQKGGVGKTTTAETIAAILGSRGKHVLLVDMDSQMNVTFIGNVRAEKTITDVFTGEDIRNAIYHCQRYDLLAADEYLANLEKLEDVEPTLLKNSLADIQADYDATMEAGGKFIHAAYGFGSINTEVPELKEIAELPQLLRKLEHL